MLAGFNHYSGQKAHWDSPGDGAKEQCHTAVDFKSVRSRLPAKSEPSIEFVLHTQDVDEASGRHLQLEAVTLSTVLGAESVAHLELRGVDPESQGGYQTLKSLFEPGPAEAMRGLLRKACGAECKKPDSGGARKPVTITCVLCLALLAVP